MTTTTTCQEGAVNSAFFSRSLTCSGCSPSLSPIFDRMMINYGDDVFDDNGDDVFDDNNGDDACV